MTLLEPHNQEKKTGLQYSIPPHFKSHLGLLQKEFLPFYTENRVEKMRRVLEKRSRRVLTVFENTHHGHNISAVLRNLDSFGFLEIIFLYSNQDMKFRATEAIDRGASQWLLPKRMTSSEKCIGMLKDSGYKIALVTLPDFSRTSELYLKSVPAFSCSQLNSKTFLDSIEDQKIALVFGGELYGISEEWHKSADLYLSVDMLGFSESLNVSVCAGILLQRLREVFEHEKHLLLLSPWEKVMIFEYWAAKNFPNGFRVLSNQNPALLPWYDFVIQSGFFNV